MLRKSKVLSFCSNLDFPFGKTFTDYLPILSVLRTSQTPAPSLHMRCNELFLDFTSSGVYVILLRALNID
jgi:hypothetical protein